MKKTFDCVEMKNRIQAKKREDEQRLGVAETRRRGEEWLARGDDPLARWWRTLAASKLVGSASTAVREEPVPFASPGKEVAP